MFRFITHGRKQSFTLPFSCSTRAISSRRGDHLASCTETTLPCILVLSVSPAPDFRPVVRPGQCRFRDGGFGSSVSSNRTMASAMETEAAVDRRLNMSLDDLIKTSSDSRSKGRGGTGGKRGSQVMCRLLRRRPVGSFVNYFSNATDGTSRTMKKTSHNDGRTAGGGRGRPQSDGDQQKWRRQAWPFKGWWECHCWCGPHSQTHLRNPRMVQVALESTNSRFVALVRDITHLRHCQDVVMCANLAMHICCLNGARYHLVQHRVYEGDH